MIIVSTCLLGIDTKYNGNANANELLKDYCRFKKFIPVCPEQLGGLETPRPPAEITGGSGEDVLSGHAKVLGDDGTDKMEEYIKGAKEVMKMVKLFDVTAAILKERSPSCGSRQIYDGTFSGRTKEGQGITTALLRRYNIPVYSEEEVTKELLDKLISEV